MAMKTAELLRLLRNDGWVWYRSKGGHRQFRHPSKPGKVTVPYHSAGSDLPAGLISAILKQADIR
jgi:predicted RNA binding protein YcfA (HicA-like mRNA interferase family)